MSFSKPCHFNPPLKVLDLRCFVVNFKGDWKYLYQLFCMERYATKEEAPGPNTSQLFRSAAYM